MEIMVFDDIDSLAVNAAGMIAQEARVAVAERGRFIMAVSGGSTPRRILNALAREEVPWSHTHFVQVDERVAPYGHPDRNLGLLRETILDKVPIVKDHVHAMPVEEKDLPSAGVTYGKTLERIAGSPPVIDLVHLGLGTDGHTASLIPGDPVLDVTYEDVAITGCYQQRRRMTLTYPIINRSRRILWLVTGSEKSEMLLRLTLGDESIPAGRVKSEVAIVFTDRAAAKLLGSKR
jgi:6-phosphogluconolactonase